ncbi:hypothetical protein [Pseudoalteromonas sp. BMB]|uniref:hypothetical protein n=1 Tax=Pseudoalteromonas sp. BMB TaxID=1874619 RepID=UPI0020C82867|nr:hypothetical protein [Pseudoalteromonas sp. BMB]
MPRFLYSLLLKKTHKNREFSKDYVSLNRAAWEERAKAHFDSEFYDVNHFLQGTSSLNPIECEILGDVSGTYNVTSA